MIEFLIGVLIGIGIVGALAGISCAVALMRDAIERGRRVRLH